MRTPAGLAGPRRGVRAVAPAGALAGVVGVILSGLAGCSMSASQSEDRDGAGDGPVDGGTNTGGNDGGGQAGAGGAAGAAGAGAGGRAGGAAGAAGASAPGTGGSSTGGGGATGAGGTSGQGPCYVTIEIRAPELTSSMIEVGPDVRVRVKGTVVHSRSAAPKLAWNITSAAGPLATMVEADENEVSFPATTIGLYTIGAQVVKEPDCSASPLKLTGVRPSAAFNVRVTATSSP